MGNDYSNSIFQNFFDADKTEELTDDMIEDINKKIKEDISTNEKTKVIRTKNHVSTLNKSDVDKITKTFSSLLSDIKQFSDKQKKDMSKNIYDQLTDYTDDRGYRPRSI